MVFNKRACDLLRQAGADSDVPAHDWWTYIVISACDGVIVYDYTPTVLYRQHAANLIGSHSKWRTKINRLLQNLSGRLTAWHTAHERIMADKKILLTARNQQCLTLFQRARAHNIFKRLYYLVKSGVYRQTCLGQIELFCAACLKRL
jgi:hypothetical protein